MPRCPGDGAESAVHASCTFVRTVEELSALSRRAPATRLDKFMRWADKGLHLLHCPIPKEKNVRKRQITINLRDVHDLKLLFDSGKRVGDRDLPVEVHANGFKYKSLSTFA